jgi:hypothetical protein
MTIIERFDASSNSLQNAETKHQSNLDEKETIGRQLNSLKAELRKLDPQSNSIFSRIFHFFTKLYYGSTITALKNRVVILTSELDSINIRLNGTAAKVEQALVEHDTVHKELSDETRALEAELSKIKTHNDRYRITRSALYLGGLVFGGQPPLADKTTVETKLRENVTKLQTAQSSEGYTPKEEIVARGRASLVTEVKQGKNSILFGEYLFKRVIDIDSALKCGVIPSQENGDVEFSIAFSEGREFPISKLPEKFPFRSLLSYLSGTIVLGKEIKGTFNADQTISLAEDAVSMRILKFFTIPITKMAFIQEGTEELSGYVYKYDTLEFTLDYSKLNSWALSAIKAAYTKGMERHQTKKDDAKKALDEKNAAEGLPPSPEAPKREALDGELPKAVYIKPQLYFNLVDPNLPQ